MCLQNINLKPKFCKKAHIRLSKKEVEIDYAFFLTSTCKLMEIIYRKRLVFLGFEKQYTFRTKKIDMSLMIFFNFMERVIVTIA